MIIHLTRRDHGFTSLRLLSLLDTAHSLEKRPHIKYYFYDGACNMVKSDGKSVISALLPSDITESINTGECFTSVKKNKSEIILSKHQDRDVTVEKDLISKTRSTVFQTTHLTGQLIHSPKDADPGSDHDFIAEFLRSSVGVFDIPLIYQIFEILKNVSLTFHFSKTNTTKPLIITTDIGATIYLGAYVK